MNDSDLEALCDAFISAYNMSDDICQTLIIASIKEINPEEGYRYIVKCFVSQMDGNLLNETATVLSKLIKKMSDNSANNKRIAKNTLLLV